MGKTMDLAVREETELAVNEDQNVLELKIIEEQVGFITTNAKDILVSAKEKCAQYQDFSLFIGDEAFAKSERAELNKAEKKAAELAAAVTKRWNAPLEEFSAIMKEIRATFKAASQGLDVGIKEAEKKDAEKKTQEIRSYFDTKKFDLVPFEQLFNDRWLLKGSKMKDIEKELNEKIDKIYGDIQLLERIPDHGTAAKAFYLEHLDIVKALAEVDRLKAAVEKITREKITRAEAEAERERQAQIEKNIADAKREEKTDPKDEQIQSLSAEALDLPESEIPQGPKILQYVLQLNGNGEELYNLKQYMSNHGIDYKKVLIFQNNDDAAVYMRQHGIAGITLAAIILG
jgi:hypothetical protein